MGCCSISRCVFHPPAAYYGIRKTDPRFTYIPTKNDSLIPVIYYNLNAEYTFVLSHENAENIYSTNKWIKKYFLPYLRVNVLTYGYSPSQDFDPTEKSVYNDIEAIYKYATKTIKIPPSKLILYGKSVGSGPSCYIASKAEVGGVILQSPFTSVLRVVFNLAMTLPFDYFSNVDRIPGIKCPIFIIHGLIDDIVPISHARRLYEVCKYKYPPYIVPHASHNDLEIVSLDFIPKIQEFINYIYRWSGGVLDSSMDTYTMGVGLLPPILPPNKHLLAKCNNMDENIKIFDRHQSMISESMLQQKAPDSPPASIQTSRILDYSLLQDGNVSNNYSAPEERKTGEMGKESVYVSFGVGHAKDGLDGFQTAITQEKEEDHSKLS